MKYIQIMKRLGRKQTEGRDDRWNGSCVQMGCGLNERQTRSCPLMSREDAALVPRKRRPWLGRGQRRAGGGASTGRGGQTLLDGSRFCSKGKGTLRGSSRGYRSESQPSKSTLGAFGVGLWGCREAG